MNHSWPLSSYKCSNCGKTSLDYRDYCNYCDQWNTYEHTSSERILKSLKNQRELLDSNINTKKLTRLQTGIASLDLVFGGGIVSDSLILLGGEPGVGKSTLVLEMIRGILKTSKTNILYASGEESLSQIRDRARRLAVHGGKQTYLFSETDLESILEECEEAKAHVLIVDSIQTMKSRECDHQAGSVTQMREVAALLMKFSKERGIASILIGHVTKDGEIAGPKTVEHLVDAVFNFEVQNKAIRRLSSSKNRFGATHFGVFFKMTSEGLKECEDSDLSTDIVEC